MCTPALLHVGKPLPICEGLVHKTRAYWLLPRKIDVCCRLDVPELKEVLKWKGAWPEEAMHVNILLAGCGQEEPGSNMSEIGVRRLPWTKVDQRTSGTYIHSMPSRSPCVSEQASNGRCFLEQCFACELSHEWGGRVPHLMWPLTFITPPPLAWQKPVESVNEMEDPGGSRAVTKWVGGDVMVCRCPLYYVCGLPVVVMMPLKCIPLQWTWLNEHFMDVFREVICAPPPISLGSHLKDGY